MYHKLIFEFFKSQEKYFSLANIKIKPQLYYHAKAKTFTIISIIFSAVIFIIFENTELSIISFFLILIFSFFTIHYSIILKSQKTRKKAESVLPLFLIELAIRLEAKEEFFTSILNVCKNSNNPLKKNLKNSVNRITKKGESVSSSFTNLSNYFYSSSITRVLSYISSAYYTGSKYDTSNLFLLSDELLERENQRKKTISGQTAMLVMSFVAISTIVPSLFLAYLSVGSLILITGLGFFEVIAISCVLFPIIDFLFLFSIKNRQEESS